MSSQKAGNFATRAIKNAWEQCKYYVMPVEIREWKRQGTQGPDGSLNWRYPTPGSVAREEQSRYVHWKTPYRDSQHNTRYTYYNTPYAERYVSTTYMKNPTVLDELVYNGLVANYEASAEEIAEATKELEKLKAEGRDHASFVQVRDEGGMSTEHRELFEKNPTALIEEITEVAKEYQQYALDAGSHRFDFVQYTTGDMIIDYDIARQNWIELEKDLEDVIAFRERRGGVKSYKGNRNIWQALDNSFDKKQVEMVQHLIRGAAPAEEDPRNERLTQSTIKMKLEQKKLAKIKELQEQDKKIVLEGFKPKELTS